ncbi:TetR/AcrR family transcriptional regulator [Allonocardiopsis opalescens]|uniref:TetR/AcrR family transcriptional regulator n=1 Tax=Allonocardiopsis opalescens TaxID=1144618 RepID=UPI001B807B8F|nr:TetR/AcrR family transcriptional regulator [Allonocardiopsis opalescens]
MSAEPPEGADSPARGRRRFSDVVAAEILDAALAEFAAHGFEGASTRAIAQRAGAHQPQINYYFSTKEALWRAAMDRLFAELGEVLDGLDIAGDPQAHAVTALRRFARFAARRPELHQIMSLESTSDSARLRWLTERHVRPLYDLFVHAWTRMRAAGVTVDLDPPRAFHLLVAFGAVPFAQAPWLRMVTGVEPSRQEWADEHADRLIALLLPGLA